MKILLITSLLCSNLYAFDKIPLNINTSLVILKNKEVIVYYPNHILTPGIKTVYITNDNIKETICKIGSTKIYPTISSKMKQSIFEDVFDMPFEDIENYEFDMLIPFELGGVISVSNIWPMKDCNDEGKTCFSYESKQLVNIYLHTQVCTGKIKLEDAQKLIVNDWFKVYLEMKGK